MAIDLKTDLAKVRNIGIMAHIDAGKTTTTERILYYTGTNHKIGEVHDGAADDGLDASRSRSAASPSPRPPPPVSGTTTRSTSSTPPATWTSPSRWSVRCASSTALSVSSTASPAWSRRSETVWRQATRYGVPRICYVNKLDRTGASFDYCVEDDPRAPAHHRGRPAAARSASEQKFQGVIDLVKMKALMWRGETAIGEDYVVEDIAPDMLEAAETAREELIHVLADNDDEFAELWLEAEETGDVLSQAQIKAAVRRAVIGNKITAVICGSSFKNKGVQPMLDAVIDYLPSPLEIPPIEGFKPGHPEIVIEKHTSNDEPLAHAGVQDRR